MRYLIFTLFLFFTTNVSAQDSEVVRLSDPVMQNNEIEVFGAEMNLEKAVGAISLTNAILDSGNDNELFIQAKVNKVCQKKGCFFIAIDGDNSARVTFKDYGFFIPTNSTGKEVVFRGILSEKILSEDQAKHFAEDAGESSEEIVGEQKEYSIIATSVMIPKSK